MTFSSNYKTITLAGLLLALNFAERVRRRVAAPRRGHLSPLPRETAK